MKNLVITLAFSLLAAGGPQAADPASPLANTRHEPVTWQQAVDINADLLKGLNPQGFQQHSTSFHLDVRGAELTQGVALQLSGPEAVVMLNRLDSAKALNTTATLLFQGQKSAHVRHVVDAEALKATGWLAGQNLALKLDAQAPAGIYTLQLAKAADDSRWVISVQDRNSPWALRARIQKQAVLAGEPVRIEARWQGEKAKLEQVQGFLIAPDGQPAQTLTFKATGNGGWLAEFPAPAANQPGLWDVQILSRGQTEKGELLRDTRLAFASALPSARLSGTPLWTLNKHQGLLEVQLQVQQAGRYAIHALLAGENGTGLKVEHARWLEPGLQTLRIPVKAEGPLRLLNLRLQDQSRLAELGQMRIEESIENSRY